MKRLFTILFSILAINAIADPAWHNTSDITNTPGTRIIYPRVTGPADISVLNNNFSNVVARLDAIYDSVGSHYLQTNLNVYTQFITNVKTPTNSLHAANKGYVDSAVGVVMTNFYVTQAVHTASIAGLSATQAVHTASITGLSSTQSVVTASITGLSSTQATVVANITSLSGTQAVNTANITSLSGTQAINSASIAGISSTQAFVIAYGITNNQANVTLGGAFTGTISKQATATNADYATTANVASNLTDALTNYFRNGANITNLTVGANQSPLTNNLNGAAYTISNANFVGDGSGLTNIISAATAAQGTNADAWAANSNNVFWADGRSTGGRTVWGQGTVANIDSGSWGAVQHGGASQMAIGDNSIGAAQFGYISGSANIVISNSAHGASQHGFADSTGNPAAATNLAVAAMQLFNLTEGQHAYTGPGAYGSILLGAGNATHQYSIVAGDGQVSHGDGSITAGGGLYGNHVGNGSGLTNIPKQASATNSDTVGSVVTANILTNNGAVAVQATWSSNAVVVLQGRSNYWEFAYTNLGATNIAYATGLRTSTYSPATRIITLGLPTKNQDQNNFGITNITGLYFSNMFLTTTTWGGSNVTTLTSLGGTITNTTAIVEGNDLIAVPYLGQYNRYTGPSNDFVGHVILSSNLTVGGTISGNGSGLTNVVKLGTPFFYCWLGADQALGSSVYTTLLAGNVVTDTVGSCYNTGTGIYTFNTNFPGIYQMSAGITYIFGLTNNINIYGYEIFPASSTNQILFANGISQRTYAKIQSGMDTGVIIYTGGVHKCYVSGFSTGATNSMYGAVGYTGWTLRYLRSL